MIDLVASIRLQDNMTKPLLNATRTLGNVERATKNMSSGIGGVSTKVDTLNQKLGKVGGTGHSSFGSIKSAVLGFTAAVGGAVTVTKTLDATLGEAARYQQSAVTIEAMFNDEKASKQYMKMVDKFAQNSPIVDTSVVMGSSKGLVGITKDLPTLQKALSIAEKMSVLDPEQGFSGASYALKELSSGDIVSMAERFEMPKKELNAIKNLSFDEQLAGIQKYLDTIGITDDTVKAMGTTTIGRFNQIKEKLASTFRTMGTSGNSQIGKALDGILKGMDSEAFDKVAKQIDAGVGTALSKLANYAKDINFEDLGNKASTAFDKISKGAKWVSDNWSGIKETVVGITTAVVTFKAAMAIAGPISAVTEATRNYSKANKTATLATTIFNGVLRANPIGLVVTAITGLITVGVLLYRNWDTVTKKTKAFWKAIGGGEGAIRIIMGPLGILIGAAIELAKNWDSTKSVWENVWGAMKRSAAETVNSVIGGINEMIGVINKIPGVNVPVIAEVNWGSAPAAPAKKLPKKNAQLGSLANYAPQNYGGLNLPGNGHKSGLDRVPYDGYLARLHQGEQVLTRREADRYDRGASVVQAAPRPVNKEVTINFAGSTFMVREEADVQRIANSIADGIAEYL